MSTTSALRSQLAHARSELRHATIALRVVIVAEVITYLLIAYACTIDIHALYVLVVSAILYMVRGTAKRDKAADRNAVASIDAALSLAVLDEQRAEARERMRNRLVPSGTRLIGLAGKAWN